VANSLGQLANWSLGKPYRTSLITPKGQQNQPRALPVEAKTPGVVVVSSIKNMTTWVKGNRKKMSENLVIMFQKGPKLSLSLALSLFLYGGKIVHEDL
jgi:hypothetical protein